MSLTLQFDPTTDNVVILKTITQHPITGAVMTDAMCDGALLIFLRLPGYLYGQ